MLMTGTALAGAGAGAGAGVSGTALLGQAGAAGLGILSALGGGLSSVWNTLTGATNTASTNNTNMRIAILNAMQQQEANNKNLAFQRDQLEYQKALNELIMQREDTAYQRTVEDMRNAGLNPLMMTGTNGSGGTIQAPEAINTQASQINYNEKPYLPNLQLGNLANEVFGTLNEIQNFEIGKDFQRQQKAQADIAETDAKEKELTLWNKIWSSNSDRLKKDWELKDLARNMIFNQEFGLFNGMSETDRNMRFLRKARGMNEIWDMNLINRNDNPEINYMYSDEKLTDYAQERALMFFGQGVLDTLKDIGNIKKELGFNFKGLKK